MNHEVPPLPNSVSLSERLRGSLTVRLVLLGFLCLLSAIPLARVRSLLGEREHRQYEAEEEIATQWGGSQSIVGPILMVPARYEEVIRESTRSKGVDSIKERMIEKRITVCVMPHRFQLESSLDPDWLARGIFRSPVYRAKIHVEGSWNAPDLKELGFANATLDWEASRVLFKVSDPRGLNSIESVIDGKALVAHPVAGGPFGGEWTSLGKGGFDQTPKSFSLDFNLRGSRFFGFLPLGTEGSASIVSNWANPSFDGCILPDQREVDVDGFKAEYRFSEFGRGIPQVWVEGAGRSYEDAFKQGVSGVELLDPINGYRLVDRSLKYGLLFVGAGFCVFFLFETLCRLSLHPMQYLLSGAGIIVFFLLLLSLSEIVAFGWAYLFAAAASAALVALYARAALGQRRDALIFGSVLGLMFSFLYIVLKQQDFALLAGSLFIFCSLGAVMYLTRKLDWSRSFEKSERGN